MYIQLYDILIIQHKYNEVDKMKVKDLYTKEQVEKLASTGDEFASDAVKAILSGDIESVMGLELDDTMTSKELNISIIQSILSEVDSNEEYKFELVNGYSINIKVRYNDCAFDPIADCEGSGDRIIRLQRGYGFEKDMSECFGIDIDDYPSIESLVNFLEENHPLAVPLSVYEHSGISFSKMGEGMQCQFDTATLGAIWVPDDCYLDNYDTIKSRDGKDAADEWHEKAIDSILNEYNHYINGENYFIDASVQDKSGEIVDGYGSIEPFGNVFGRESIESAMLDDVSYNVASQIQDEINRNTPEAKMEAFEPSI